MDTGISTPVGRRVPPAAEPLGNGAGTAPAGYTLRRVLGHGRLGLLLLCGDDATGRDVAVRILDAQPPDAASRAVLESELAAASAASRHPCAVPSDAVWVDPRAGVCLRQQLRAGPSAQALLDAGATWETDDVLVLGVRAVASLTHSHRRGSRSWSADFGCSPRCAPARDLPRSSCSRTSSSSSAPTTS